MNSQGYARRRRGGMTHVVLKNSNVQKLSKWLDSGHKDRVQSGCEFWGVLTFRRWKKRSQGRCRTLK